MPSHFFFSSRPSPGLDAHSHNSLPFPDNASWITLRVSRSLFGHSSAPRDGWSATFHFPGTNTASKSHPALCKASFIRRTSSWALKKLQFLYFIDKKNSQMTTCNNGACTCTIPRMYLTGRSDAYRTARRDELHRAPTGIPPHIQAELDAQFLQTFNLLTESRPTCNECHHLISVHADPQPSVSAKALQGLEALGRQVQRTSSTPRSQDTQVSGGGTEQPSSHICQKSTPCSSHRTPSPSRRRTPTRGRRSRTSSSSST